MEENTKSFWDNKNLEVTDEVLSMEESSMLYDIVSNVLQLVTRKWLS